MLKKNGSFRNRENLQYEKKTADPVLLSLFMRTNGKCEKFLRPLAPAKALFCFPSEPNNL